MRALLMALTIALFAAAPASAAPDCADTAPNTRMCVTPGHTAIVTTPQPGLVNPLQGWGLGWGTPIFGLGGGGIWIGL